MAVLIICEPADVHASAVAWALEKCGIEAIRWHPAPPWASPGEVRFESGRVDYSFAGKGGEIRPSSIDAVWRRRPSRPVFPPGLRESDRQASRYELAAFHGGVQELLPRDILWANPPAAQQSANFKLRQLAAAIEVGLTIPRTLVTDDASQARAFVASEPEGQVIYKPFYSFHWQRDGRLYQSVTTPVAEADLHDPQALLWSPGIFQKFVPKACELRVSLFGRTCIAARIFDQDPVDWRTRQSDMKVAPFDLPEIVERRLHALMDALGLVMGMADLIVTPDGDYVFLEINEQGQFLWVEDMCPELPLLAACTHFLASGNPRFAAEAVPGSPLNYARFAAEEADRFHEEKLAFLEAGGILDHSFIDDNDDAERAEKRAGNVIR